MYEGNRRLAYMQACRRIAALEAENKQLRGKAADAYGALSEVADCLCMGDGCKQDFLKGFEALQLIGKAEWLARSAKRGDEGARG